MVLPPGLFLKTIRVAGSALFVGGAIVFLVCAGQVYFNKLFRRVPASGGLYRWIRHPQYLALGRGAGPGDPLAAIPDHRPVDRHGRALHLLARDEERRMVNQFGEEYRAYMARTGMFLPRVAGGPGRRPPPVACPRADRSACPRRSSPSGAPSRCAPTPSIQLPLWSSGRVMALAILPGDGMMLEHRMEDVLELPEVKARLGSSRGPFSSTCPAAVRHAGNDCRHGPELRLYEHHQTLAMISDWIFHPFRHLQGGHTMHPEERPRGARLDAVVRRLIFLSVETPREDGDAGSSVRDQRGAHPAVLRGRRRPRPRPPGIKDLGPGTGWGDVPTPLF